MARTAVVVRLTGGNAAPIALGAGLLGFANGQAAGAEYAVASTGNGWQLSGGSFADVRRVGNVWVAIEVPRNAPAGLYLNVFCDAPLTQ